ARARCPPLLRRRLGARRTVDRAGLLPPRPRARVLPPGGLPLAGRDHAPENGDAGGAHLLRGREVALGDDPERELLPRSGRAVRRPRLPECPPNAPGPGDLLGRAFAGSRVLRHVLLHGDDAQRSVPVPGPVASPALVSDSTRPS